MTPWALRRQYDKAIAYHQAQRQKRYEKINAYKMGRGCIDCGYAEHPAALDFDHRDPSLKIKGVSSMLTFSWKKIVAELDKCDVRCACCHRIKTHNLNQTRRRPAAGSAGDGPCDEITTDHLPERRGSGSSPPPPLAG